MVEKYLYLCKPNAHKFSYAVDDMINKDALPYYFRTQYQTMEPFH